MASQSFAGAIDTDSGLRLAAAVPPDAVETALREWLPVFGALSLIAGAAWGALWSLAQRWNVSVRLETRDGRLRVSATVSARPTGSS